MVNSKFCNAFITLGLLLKIDFQAVVDFSVAKATLQSQLEIIILHHSLFINLHSSFLHFATFKLFSLFLLKKIRIFLFPLWYVTLGLDSPDLDKVRQTYVGWNMISEQFFVNYSMWHWELMITCLLMSVHRDHIYSATYQANLETIFELGTYDMTSTV